MKTLLACLFCLIAGTLLGARITAGAAVEAAAVIVECIKNPESCGLQEEDLDPQERFIPT